MQAHGARRVFTFVGALACLSETARDDAKLGMQRGHDMCRIGKRLPLIVDFHQSLKRTDFGIIAHVLKLDFLDLHWTAPWSPWFRLLSGGGAFLAVVPVDKCPFTMLT